LPGASRHELTGDALVPETVGPVIARVTSFLASSASSNRERPRQDR
jgi:hypothetical protein